MIFVVHNRFPLADPHLMAQWLQALNYKGSTEKSLVCGQHFVADCYFSVPVSHFIGN